MCYEVLNKGWLSINGNNTKIFEKKFNNYLGTKYTVAVQSGTAALHTALKALGIKVEIRYYTKLYVCIQYLCSFTIKCNSGNSRS